MTWHGAAQLIIAVLSGGAIAVLALVRRGWLPARAERWGWLAGLCAQPFWAAETWSAGQLGMLAAAIVFTPSWAVGLWAAIREGRRKA